jgi:uncharacterized protein
MSPNTIGGMLALGLGAGIIGGMFGIGGGLIMVPALILAFGFDPKTATGTSLVAQLFPVGLLAVVEYWRRDEVKVVPGLWMAVGLFLGALIGAKITGLLSPAQMKRGYGIFLLLVGFYFLLAPGGVARKTPALPASESPATAPDQVH